MFVIYEKGKKMKKINFKEVSIGSLFYHDSSFYAPIWYKLSEDTAINLEGAVERKYDSEEKVIEINADLVWEFAEEDS